MAVHKKKTSPAERARQNRQKRNRSGPVEMPKSKASKATRPDKLRKMQREARVFAKKLKKDLKVTVMKGGADHEWTEKECISTGFQEIDDVITGKLDEEGNFTKGAGKGWPRGRIIEIYGPEAAAKTSLALATIASAQARGELCGLVDVEHALDPVYARKTMDVDMDALIWTQPEDGNEALSTLKWMVANNLSLAVLDSVAALVTRAELEGNEALGQQARLMSKTCREITPMLAKNGPCVIFINQIRHKIGGYGNPEVTSGGNALKFYATLRTTVRKKKDLTKAGRTKGEPVTLGHRIQLRVIKNKVAPCGGRMLFDVKFGKGISIPKLRGGVTPKSFEEE